MKNLDGGLEVKDFSYICDTLRDLVRNVYRLFIGKRCMESKLIELKLLVFQFKFYHTNTSQSR